MKQKEIPILIFIYNSYKDPLFQNLLLTYIKTLSKTRNYRFDLITFEQTQYPMSSEEILNEKIILKQWNIYWQPRTFHTGRILLLKKLYDVITTLFTVIQIKLKHRSKYVFAFANVAAAYSILFSKLLRLKLVIYSYEPHSQFMAELGEWSKKSFKYIILNYLEQLAGKYADYILTGTKHGVELLDSMESKASIYRAPTAVDPELFKFDPDHRISIRKDLKIEQFNLFVYFGKFGGLYYKEEVAELCEAIYKKNENSFFLIATNHDRDIVHSWFESTCMPKSNYRIRDFIPNTEIPGYLSAADFGIVAIPPSSSQKYRSPTKVAEYLLCGLPYIVCKGVSEDDEYAINHQVGVVVDDFRKESYIKKHDLLNEMLNEDKSLLRNRCREIGLTYRSKSKIDQISYEIFT